MKPDGEDHSIIPHVIAKVQILHQNDAPFWSGAAPNMHITPSMVHSKCYYWLLL